MRVLYCCHAENYHIKKWAPLLAGKGLDIHIATFLPYDFDHPNITVHPMKKLFRNVRYIDFLRSSGPIKSIIKRINPDLLFCSVATTYGLGGWLSGFQPFVVQTWSRDIAAPRSVNLREWLMVKTIGTMVLQKASGVTTDGFAYRSHLIQQHPELAATTLATPWGIDIEKYQYTPAQQYAARHYFQIPEGHKVLASPRGIFWYYQPENVLPMLLRLSEKRDDCTLLILTLNHERPQKIQQLLDALHERPNVSVIDRFLEIEEMQKVWAASDFFLSCPTFDGVSESVQEGRAAGAIPILNRIASNFELAEEGKHAFFVEPEAGTEVFCSRLNTILETPPEKLKQMRTANRAWINQYGDVNKTADRLIDFFNECLNRS